MRRGLTSKGCRGYTKGCPRAVPREQIIRDLFEVAGAVGSLFSGGLGLRTLPATAANIERVAKKVEYVVEVIKLISGLYEQGRNIHNDFGTFNRAATFLDRASQSLISQ